MLPMLPLPLKPFLSFLLILTLTGLLAGCTVGPDFRQPEPPTSSSYLAAPLPEQPVAAQGPGGNPQQFKADLALASQWWSLFGSKSLDRLVEAALAESPALAQARARLIRARENLYGQTGAFSSPQADARLGATQQQLNPSALGIANIPTPGPFTLYNATLSVSYALDLFGANRRALEALAARVDFQHFELEAARQTLAANVVTAAIRQAALQAQLERLREVLAVQEQQRAIIAARHELGGVAALDLHNQDQLLAQTRASLPPLEKRLTQVSHQLAVYLGREPATAKIDRLDLDSLQLPAELPLSLPSALARQRPDIRAAEALWHEACANVGVATANLYPQITLSANLGAQQTSPGDLVRSVNVWNLGGNLMQPIFHGGELQARKRSALAAYDEAGAAYRQTVLRGLQEVADTLVALDGDGRTLKFQSEAAEQAGATYGIARQQCQEGGISQLALLDARRQLLQAEFNRVQAQADRYTDTAAFLHALGGGWWNARPEGEGTREQRGSAAGKEGASLREGIYSGE